MMTKWDTIQADVSDAYTYLDEELELDKANKERAELFGHDVDLISLDELTDSEIALDWEDSE